MFLNLNPKRNIMQNDNIFTTLSVEQFLMEQEREVENLPLFKAALSCLFHHEDVCLVEDALGEDLSYKDKAKMYHTLWCLFSQDPPHPDKIFRWATKDPEGSDAYDSLLEKMKKLEDEYFEHHVF